MVKGRLWRFLMIFLGLYLLFLLYFFRSVGNDTIETSTTSPLPHAQRKMEDKTEPIKLPEPIVEKKPEVSLAGLEPVMNKDTLGNYEPKDLPSATGPGENGQGVQLQGEDEVKRGEKSVADYGFNEVASEKISLDRRARDTRYNNRMILFT